MKKVLLLVLTLLFAFSLTACRRTPAPIECDDNQTLIDGVCVDNDITPPVLTGVVDVTIYLDESFDPLAGVSAIDDVDGDITDQIVITGTVNTGAVGTYFLRYVIEDSAGNRTERTRYVTVTFDPSLIGDEFVPNGDFSLGMAMWTTTTGLEGGNGTFEVVDGELKITVTGVSGGLWEPRLENKGLTFEQGKFYEVEFQARAEAPRAIHVQIGELLDGPPWFTNFKTGQTTIFDLSTEMQTFSFVFSMSLATNTNGAVIFEMGSVPMSDSTMGTLLTTIYLDNVVIREVEEFEDDIPPVISGAGNRSLVQGTPFDPMAGVTAFDNVDGDLTDEIVVTGTVDVDTIGEYTLTYTVSDEAGNETVVTRVITVVEPVIDDEPKSADYGWRAFVNDWEGSAATLEVVDGELVFSPTTVASMDASWKLQVIQDAQAFGYGEENEGHMALLAGRTYRVTFDARATVAGNIKLAIGHDVGGWTGYFESDPIAITTTMETITVEFTLDSELNTAILAQFKLELGLLFAGTDGTESFILDNVKIELLEDDVFVDTDLIVNGTFTAEEVGPTGPAFGWRPFLNDWEGTAGTLTIVNGRLVLDLTSVNSSDNWHVQIIQDAYALGTGEDNVGSMVFEAGKTYRVTFDARASVAGEVNFGITHFVGGFTAYHMENFTVARTWESFEIIFTLDDPEMDYSNPAQFKFEMGALFANEVDGQFFLDNIVLEVLEGEEYVATDLLVNGDFSITGEEDDDEEPAPITSYYGWRPFINDWEGSEGSFEVVDNQLIYNITAISTMDENWKIQIIQDAFALGTGPDNAGSIEVIEGKTYRLTFDAKASVAGNITVIVGHSVGGFTPYFMDSEVAITTEMQTFTLVFTLDDPEMDYTVLAQLKLEMGMLFAGADAPQSFTLANVMLEVLEGDVYVDAEQIVNGNFDMELPVDDDDDDEIEITNTYGWRAFTNFWEGSEGEITVVDGELVFDISIISVMDENWKLQIIQDAFALGTGADNEGSIQFEAGKTYRVTFDARASVAGDFTLAIGHSGGGWTAYHMATLGVTTETQTFTVEFTLDDPEMDYTTLAQFKLEMGLLFAGETSGQFILDNVLIEVLVDLDYVDAELIINGTFDIADPDL
ncbi:immunoglobulin-like domain-containing protein, partial [Liberiplasma polymorphum]|uniref:immunoglobulin-like domain-containing protein n=1 Tax=Liberiplasma polymorphum TaxID=3374570 RepID=UPI003771AF53